MKCIAMWMRGKYRTLAIDTVRARTAEDTRFGPDRSVRDRATGTSESGSTLRRTEELHRTTPTETAPMPFVREQFYLAARTSNGWCGSSPVTLNSKLQPRESEVTVVITVALLSAAA